MAFGTTPEWFHSSDPEDVVWQSRPHPVAMGEWLPIGVALALAGIVLVGWSVPGKGFFLTLGAGLAVVGSSIVIARYLVWTTTRYVITADELYVKRGIVSRDVTGFRLDRVQNVSLEQSAVGRLLGYGDLTVFTAGSGDPELTLERAPRPGRAVRLLNDRLEAASKGIEREHP